MSAVWPLAGRQWLPVSAHIPYRFLVTYRAPAARLVPYVPAPLQLDERAGFGFVSVCALRLEGLRPSGWPRAWAFETPEFLVRVAVRYRGEPSFFTCASWVASRRLAWLAGHFSHYRPQWAAFEERSVGGRHSLRSVDSRGWVSEFDAESEESGGTADPWPLDSVFESPADAEAFLLGMAGSVDVDTAGAVSFQPIVHSAWKAQPVRLHRAHFDFVERLDVGAVLDNVLGMTAIEQRWETARPW